jgi:hypothetical protein
MECGAQCRKPKRFCSEDHKEKWLASTIARRYPHPVSAHPGAMERSEPYSTLEAIEWRQKLSLSRPF